MMNAKYPLMRVEMHDHTNTQKLEIATIFSNCNVLIINI